jgi:hypothetical protein
MNGSKIPGQVRADEIAVELARTCRREPTDGSGGERRQQPDEKANSLARR